MHLKQGDPVQLRLGRDVYVDGKVVSTDHPAVFSEAWSITAEITEGGHPLFGQVGIFPPCDVSFEGVVTG